MEARDPFRMDTEAAARSYVASPTEGVLRGAAEWVAVAGVLFGFHVFTVEYVHSSFLSQFFSRTVVGLLMTATSFVSLCALLFAPRVLARIGAYRLAFGAALACAGSSLVLGFVREWPIVVGAFGVLAVSAPLVLLCLDVFLERAIRSENVTGSVRGRHLAAVMGSALLSPLIAGTLAGSGGRLELVYLASACFLAPFLLVLVVRLRAAGEAAPRPEVSLRATLRRVARTGDLFHVAAAQFLLRFYFAWMVVYLPLYLHQTVGFSWGDIGLILSFMLVPYLLLEWPAGVVADRWLGEQELLVAGFTIIALATAALPFLGVGSVLSWGALLCVTRIGAALIESMTEVHFFKRVDATDVELVSFFRMLRPLAFTLGPLLATVVLYVVDLRFLWLVLAVVMLTGIIHAARLVDTR